MDEITMYRQRAQQENKLMRQHIAAAHYYRSVRDVDMFSEHMLTAFTYAKWYNNDVSHLKSIGGSLE